MYMVHMTHVCLHVCMMYVMSRIKLHRVVQMYLMKVYLHNICNCKTIPKVLIDSFNMVNLDKILQKTNLKKEKQIKNEKQL